MAGNTPARPSADWLGDELRGDFHTAEHQVKVAQGRWFSGRRQAEHQREAKAS
jgi:hypothetical protein